MLMSQAAISSCVAARPSFGETTVTGLAHPASERSARTSARSRVRILYLAVRRHAPHLDRVVVEDDVRAVLGDETLARRLHRAGRVRRATLDGRGVAVPCPRHPE